MTFTSSDLEALKEALISGALSISSNGRTVTFRNTEDLLKTINMIEAQISKDQNPNQSLTPRRTTATIK